MKFSIKRAPTNLPCELHIAMKYYRSIRYEHLIGVIKSVKCRMVHTTNENSLKKIRNIGILAHIDAGKTTTTERMLYYSGTIHHMGEVHHGNTVTDYLEQERDRGITITSASVTIPWLKHNINIIDTPGHIDFTFEVEQSLNVIDGAVIILDGSAGVEAQTVTVWRQADKYHVPRIIYVNKMDRPIASFDMCLESLRSKFHTEFLPLQVPVGGSKSGITSIIDIISKRQIKWQGEQGEQVVYEPLAQNEEITTKALDLRNELVDKLSVLDDSFADIVLNLGSLEDVGAVEIYDALKRVTLQQKAVPVICGSSYKNIGVQKLMDAVVDILPSPDLREDLQIYKHFNANLCARAFKVVHDKQKGPVTFFRIYSGSMKKNQKIYNVSKDKTEQIQRLMVALANEYEEVDEITTGNVAAVSGLKLVHSGDMISIGENSVRNAAKKLAKETKISEEESWKKICPKLQIPDPVFFRSIEAPSQMYQPALDAALEQLQREDPSLHVKIDKDTGQTILGGMGELHLEIVKDRILKTYKVEADLGPLQIAYKEYVQSSARDTVSTDLTIGDTRQRATIEMSVFPREDDKQEVVVLDRSPDYAPNTHLITPRRISLIKTGIETGVQRGPKVGCPVVNACFMVHMLLVEGNTSASIISSTAAQCVQKVLSKVTTSLIEPVMTLEVIADERNMRIVLADLAQRNAELLNHSIRADNHIIQALVPLSQLLGYSKALRTSTSGNASFTMEFNCYKELSGVNEAEAIKEITGFYPV